MAAWASYCCRTKHTGNTTTDFTVCCTNGSIDHTHTGSIRKKRLFTEALRMVTLYDVRGEGV